MSLEKRPSLTAEEIFGSLTLVDTSDKPAPPRPDAAKPSPPPDRRGPPPPYRSGAPPPPGSRRGPPPNHRPTRSQEEALRARRMQENGGRGGQPDPSRSPQRRQERRPRRNSDSSILDNDKIMTEEERKQRDQRRRERERERRHRDNREKKNAKPSRRVDIIDQLDVTGSGVFHHDGPFDALHPHRNRQGSRRAPMQAFPKDSLNNTIGGSGPLNARPDHAMFMGQQDDEAFMEWSRGSKDKASHKDTPVFDPLSRGSILHGDESLGLGTSTFLEGTPAARTAIQKREEEQKAEFGSDGLQRKKSLAHRIRNMNRGGREYQPSGRGGNPEFGYGSRRSPSQGGPASASLSERNPFFNEYGSGKGEDEFTVQKIDSNGSRPSPASPGSGPSLERRSTTDATGGDDAQPKASGILGRMKSLKGRRQRPAPAAGEAEPIPTPGTAV
ncbi:Pal1 cell morphology protein-domain-containing protein [Chaetomium fimeti]|uniref:Pal1 cell morphology protein-domain-containing protein n=1 Tax=Chaetomium fimeti TaxID=1854472 RepID=A0AAE0HLK7_9PEZI|nr:Pal1 cell morphology protein-domain-containing protein [Chaetomium fimeti]